MIGLITDKISWHIVDGHKPSNFQFRVLLICSPRLDYYDSFQKKAIRYYMPVWSYGEIESCRAKFYNDNLDSILTRQLFDIWGGVPRYVLFKASGKCYVFLLSDLTSN